MSQESRYVIELEPEFEAGEHIDVQTIADSVTDAWYNQTLCAVNDSLVRLGVVEGEYHWHQHDNEDEFFFVVEGRLVIELPDRRVELTPRQAFTVPKGVQHRPIAPERTIILMIEQAGVRPTGDDS